MLEYIKTLEEEFQRNANADNAIQMAKYMKNHFAFFGIKSPERKIIQAPFLHKDVLPKKIDLFPIVKILWLKPQREFQYFTHALVFKYKNEFEKEDIKLLE